MEAQMKLETCSLGIELGSTRIKAVLIDRDHNPIAQGDFTWENQFNDGVWTYPMELVHSGVQTCFANLKADVKAKFGEELTTVGALGVSAMMHGYLPFDKDGKQLAEFRTWRNTITGEAARKLTDLFGFNIPQRWSIAHLYQAILSGEAHVKDIAYLTTLAGYIHWRLTGEKVMGIGEASGMFPIDSNTNDYDAAMLEKFDRSGRALSRSLRNLAGGHPRRAVRGRCGYRHGGDELRARQNRKRFGGHERLCHDRHGQASRCASRDRYGHNPSRRASCDGALQQLHERYQCMGKPLFGILCADGNAGA